MELVKGCQQSKYNATATAFVDDINIVVFENLAEENCNRLKQVYKFCEKWTKKHGSSFNVNKYQLLHLAKEKADLKASLQIGETKISPASKLKLLEVYLDSRLSGKAHVRAVQDKASVLVAAFKTISESIWGASVQQCKQMYCQTIRPALTYGAVAWFTPEDALGIRKGTVKKLQTIQGQCLRAVAGAYKAISTEALKAEIGVMPLDLHTGNLAATAAARSELGEAGQATRSKIQRILTKKLPGSRRRKQKQNYRTPLTVMTAGVKEAVGSPLKLTENEQEARDIQKRELLGKIKTVLRKISKERWKNRWKEGVKGAHSRRLQPSLQSNVPLLHKGLRKPQSALIIQLRTGKIGFRSFLFHRKVPEVKDPNCSCGSGEEMTVEYILLKCQKWKDLRARVLEDQDRRSLQRLLSTKKGCLAVVRMVQQTELIAQFRKADLEREWGMEEEGEGRRPAGLPSRGDR